MFRYNELDIQSLQDLFTLLLVNNCNSSFSRRLVSSTTITHITSYTGEREEEINAMTSKIAILNYSEVKMDQELP